MIIEFSEAERQIIQQAKSNGWHVVSVSLSPGIKGFQLRDELGNGRQYAASEPECWKMAILGKVIG